MRVLDRLRNRRGNVGGYHLGRPADRRVRVMDTPWNTYPEYAGRYAWTCLCGWAQYSPDPVPEQTVDTATGRGYVCPSCGEELKQEGE